MNSISEVQEFEQSQNIKLRASDAVKLCSTVRENGNLGLI
jgi:hypothetical protein